LVLFIHLIGLIIKKLKSKNKKPLNRIRALVKKRVYTEDGIYIGNIKDIILGKNKIDNLKIKLSKQIKAGEKLRVRGIFLDYKDVRDVGEIIIVKKDVEEWLKYLSKK